MRGFAETAKQPLENMMNSKPCQETESKVVWTRLKVFWCGKDDSIEHRIEKEEEGDRRRGREAILKCGMQK